MDITTFNKSNCYLFDESIHVYYWNGKPVRYSVTKFIDRYFKEFDAEAHSIKYAKKHNLDPEAVRAEWDRKGKISADAGTVIHEYLENIMRGKIVHPNFQTVDESIRSDVEARVNILLPKAEHFARDTKNKLIPLQMEYTVGFEDYIAGNIDLLCWNDTKKEIQIWDYKNIKEMTTYSPFGNCKEPFNKHSDCSLVHYSIQLSFYKVLLQRLLGITIGKEYLVHFNYNDTTDNFAVYPAIDFTKECEQELNKFVDEINSNMTQEVDFSGVFSDNG